jgi:hypothetical protein
MVKMIRRALCIAVIFFTFSLRAVAEAASLKVEWEECLISVSAEGVPLSSILGTISYQTGLEVRGSEHLKEPVTIHFSNLTLP